jgi:hypothetical protein
VCLPQGENRVTWPTQTNSRAAADSSPGPKETAEDEDLSFMEESRARFTFETWAGKVSISRSTRFQKARWSMGVAEPERFRLRAWERSGGASFGRLRAQQQMMSPRTALTSRSTPVRQELKQKWWRLKEGEKLQETNAPPSRLSG